MWPHSRDIPKSKSASWSTVRHSEPGHGRCPRACWRADRDVTKLAAELAVKVDANRAAINALGEQTRERFDALERKVNTGFRQRWTTGSPRCAASWTLPRLDGSRS